MPSSARSLAEDLRRRDDDQLEHLFAQRPGLLRPVPKSFSDLALRANSAPSTIAALDTLTAPQLDVIEACCALAPAGRFALADLVSGLDSDASVIGPIVTDLYDRALLWGGSADLRVPSAVREVMGPEPCGMDLVVRCNQTGVRIALGDPGAFADRLQLAPEDSRALLLSATWGPAMIPFGPGHDWLAEQDFLATDEAGRLIIPREIALLIRRGLLLAEPCLTAPEPPATDPRQIEVADQHAGHAADQFVRDMDRVMAYLARGSLGRQSNGAFPARDWDRMALAVGLPPAQLGLILALAWTAQWTEWDDENRLRPTTEYEAGMDRPVAERWAELARTWLRMARATPREPARVLATPDDPVVPDSRALVLAAVNHGARADVAGWLRWYRPRLNLPDTMISATLSEADTIGFAFGGVPAAPARLHRAERDDATALARAVAPHLPPLTDRIVLQADLTATALGPLEPAVERRMTSVAEWESGGAATVFRFTTESIRAALARGASGPELLEWLSGASATPVPQALSVLIGDQAGALPTMSVHSSGSVITCEPADVADLLTDSALATLGLRQVAPGVLLSAAGADEVAQALLESGRAATQPDTEAAPVAPNRPPSLRTTTQPAPRRVINSLRNVDRSDSVLPTPPGELRPAGPSEILAALHTAVMSHSRIWLSFAGDQGERMTHLIEPLQLDAGDVCAFDHTAGEIRTIPLERIVASAAS